MKKIIQALMVLSIVSSSTAVFGANASLVPGIRDSALLSMSVSVDQYPVQGSIDTTSLTGTANEEATPHIVIDGSEERKSSQSVSTSTMIPTEEIATVADLKEFIKSLVKKNSDLVTVSINGNSISVTRNTQGKITDIVSVPFEETTQVIRWGNGTSLPVISTPWWNMFSGQYTDNQITKNLYTKLKTIPSSLFVTNLHIQTQSQILNENNGTDGPYPTNNNTP